ncbi:hypothetical protein LPJ53_004669, partial [Coemansia erecta]
MGFFSTISAAVSIATSENYDINWDDKAARQAAMIHWEQVRPKANDALPLASLRLTSEQKQLLDQLLAPSGGLFPETPTDELLAELPKAIPPASLNRIIGSIIDDCLKNHKHDETETEAEAEAETEAEAEQKKKRKAYDTQQSASANEASEDTGSAL